MEHHPEGILMEADTYNALVKTIQRDCRVLESFKIMDYSLLLGVHNLDLAQKEKAVRDLTFLIINKLNVFFVSIGRGFRSSERCVLHVHIINNVVKVKT